MSKIYLIILASVLTLGGYLLFQQDHTESVTDIPFHDSESETARSNLSGSVHPPPNNEKDQASQVEEKAFNPFSLDSKPDLNQVKEKSVAEEEPPEFDELADEAMRLLEAELAVDDGSEVIQDYGVWIDDPLTYIEPESDDNGEVQDYGEQVDDPLTYAEPESDDDEVQDYGEQIDDPSTYIKPESDDNGEVQDYGEPMDAMAGVSSFDDVDMDNNTKLLFSE